MKYMIVLLCLLGTSVVSGCATPMGPVFAPTTDLAPDKALVYVYKAKVYGGSLYKLTANGVPVAQLQKGGYFPYVANPGSVTFEAHKLLRVGELIPLSGKRTLKLTLAAGETRYVKITSGLSVKLIEVPPAQAQGELSSCRLLPEWDGDS